MVTDLVDHSVDRHSHCVDSDIPACWCGDGFRPAAVASKPMRLILCGHHLVSGVQYGDNH